MTTTADPPSAAPAVTAEDVEFVKAQLRDKVDELRACETAATQASKRNRRGREQQAAEIVRLHYRLDQIAAACLGVRPWSHKLIREYALDRSEVLFPSQLSQ